MTAYWPGLDYSAWPSYWLDLARDLCGSDDGNLSSVPEYMRPYVVAECTPEGWIKRPCTGARTPFQLAKFTMAFDTDAPLPWRGMGTTPADLIDAWERAEVERAENANARPAIVSSVYFIGSDEGPIKIGTAMVPERRLKQIQTGHPHRLGILALLPGGATEELTYHERFADTRLVGEWFERTPELMAEIARLSSPTPIIPAERQGGSSTSHGIGIR